MPKARSTVKPLDLTAPRWADASPEEKAYTRGLYEGMERKVNRIQQEVVKRQALGMRLARVIGRQKKRIAELEAALAAANNVAEVVDQ